MKQKSIILSCLVLLIFLISSCGEDTKGTDASTGKDAADSTDLNDIKMDLWVPDCTDQEKCPQYEIECADDIDNDGDSKTDCDDSDCKAQPPCTVKINEIFYNPAGTDTGKAFVELWTLPDTALDGFTIEGINGLDKNTYVTIKLDGKKAKSSGYFIIAQPDSEASLAAVADLLDAGADLQNGPDSVVLKYNGKVVDTVGYGEDAPVSEGKPAVITASGQSLSRNDSHTDTDDNSKDFSACIPSPSGTGKCNLATSETNCTDKIDDDNDGYTDCIDYDCGADPACTQNKTETVCGDSIDNDQDGSTDCIDADCALSAACVTSDKPIVFIGPDECQSVIQNLINSSKTSIKLVMYQFSVSEFITGLINAKKKGIDVKIIIDKNQPVNQTTYSTLNNAGVNIKWSSDEFQYMHQKTMVIDDSKVLIFSGNFNNISMESERNYGVVDFNSVHIADINSVFQADWNGTEVSLPSATDVILSPVNSKKKLLDLINSAKKTLVFEEMQFGDTSFQDALFAKKTAGIDIRVIIASPTWITANQEAGDLIKSKGIPVKYLKKPGIHAKLIVVDGEQVFIGSTNISYTSITKNRELGIVYYDKDMISKIMTTFEKDWNSATSF
jgi:phosphatidylserine/phosphatidylglycerophosphate/cardiolipin synthase-like enzyme